MESDAEALTNLLSEFNEGSPSGGSEFIIRPFILKMLNKILRLALPIHGISKPVPSFLLTFGLIPSQISGAEVILLRGHLKFPLLRCLWPQFFISKPSLGLILTRAHSLPSLGL